GSGSLGDHRVHPRLATQPGRDPGRGARRRPAGTAAAKQGRAKVNNGPERWQRRFLLAGLCGVLACGLAALIDVEQVLRSYLFAYIACLGLAVGSLALTMLHHLTGGAWGLALRPVWRAA